MPGLKAWGRAKGGAEGGRPLQQPYPLHAAHGLLRERCKGGGGAEIHGG